jgi:ATP-dependent Clp protease ATP-binding subunit ClpA
MKFSPEVEMILALAMAEAQRQRSELLTTPHLFIGLTRLNGRTCAALTAAGHDPKALRDQLRAALGRGEAPEGREPKLTTRAAGNLSRAEEIAWAAGAAAVQEEHLLEAILSDETDSLTLRVLRRAGVDVAAWSPRAAGRAPLLDRLGRDLTALASAGRLDPLIGRREQLREVVRTLARQKKNNPILVGPAGVGKTAIVEGLAALIVAGVVPVELQGQRIIELPMAEIVAGTLYRGQFEERLLQVVRETQAAGNVILFVDEFHTVVGAGAANEAPMDAADILKPALARGELRVIGATTPEEYERHIAPDPALERRLAVVWVPEPSVAETVDILKGVRAKLEKHHGVTLRDDALLAAVQLSVDWMPNRRLPDKALDLLDDACARVRIPTVSQPLAKDAELVVTAKSVAEVVAERNGLAAEALLDVDAGAA